MGKRKIIIITEEQAKSVINNLIIEEHATRKLP